MKISRTGESDKDFDTLEDRVEKLTKSFDKSPFGKMIKNKSPGQSTAFMTQGFRWIYLTQFLANIQEENGFDVVMACKFFSQDEKEFILFNINRLKEISEWSYNKFVKEVSIFKKEGEDV